MTVIVTGSRRATERHADVIRKALAELPMDTLVLHGDCRGVDQLAEGIAWMQGKRTRPYPVPDDEWRRLGPAAGPLRNQRMLDEGKPDMLLAFPDAGSRGTADMIRRARKAGVTVKTITLWW